jgi:hypothetical protein
MVKTGDYSLSDAYGSANDETVAARTCVVDRTNDENCTTNIRL